MLLALLLAAAVLPDARLTPGAVMTTSRAEVCERGYSKRARSVSQAMKNEVMRRYGIDTRHHGDIEIDHSVPISIGGANTLDNLWAQRARPRPGYHEKDRLEFAVWVRTCRGDMELKYAQKRIAEDWIGFYAEVFGRKP